MSFFLSKSFRIPNRNLALAGFPRNRSPVRALPAVSRAPRSSMGSRNTSIDHGSFLPQFRHSVGVRGSPRHGLPAVALCWRCLSHLRTVPVTGRRQLLFRTKCEDLAPYNSQDWLSMHGKDLKLNREDLVTKPRCSIPGQLLTAQTAKGLKTKLYVYEDFGRLPNLRI